MREVHERDTGDDADTKPDRRPDAAAGRDSDTRRPAIATVGDSSTRIALALEYRQRVEGTQVVASSAAGTVSPNDREDRARRTPDESDRVSASPPGKDTGVQGDNHRGEDVRSGELARQPARGADLPVSARELPNARDVLPNLERAEIDERKFSEYSMNPGHPDNKGKQMAGGHLATMWITRKHAGRQPASCET